MEFGKRFKKKLLCVLVATSLVLTGCSGGEPTDDGEDDVPKGQYELVVMNQYGEIVPGAAVSIGGSTYTTSDYVLSVIIIMITMLNIVLVMRAQERLRLKRQL